MFVYNLATRAMESGKAPGVPLHALPSDGSVQHNPDAVVAVFPFKEPDTFSFTTLLSNPMGLKQGDTSVIDEKPQENVMDVAGPILLDRLLMSISVQSSKSAHQDGMQLSLKDPENVLLSLINPGDWIVCWMFDNTADADLLRARIKAKEFDGLNAFNSGIKFVGKTLAPRIQHSVMQDGSFIKTCSVQASAFSELDSNMYYDPQVGATNINGLQFIGEMSKLINEKFNGIPRRVDSILATLLPACLGCPPRSGGQSTPNSPMRVPAVIGRILGFTKASTFMDILTAIIGIQKYGDNYLPPLALGVSSTVSFAAKPATQWGISFVGPSSTPSLATPAGEASQATIPFVNLVTHGNIWSTGKPLTGAVYPQIAPFNNVPVWSILEQHLIPVANEMYSTLKLNQYGGVTPHLIMRQIPFSSDQFTSKSPPDYTAFRELPRWKVEPSIVLSYDTGKSNSMRVNYVHVQVSGAVNNKELQAAQRAKTIPRWDAVDISRNGLKPFITQVSATYEPTSMEYGQKWTDMVTDRLIGAHLKLSGSIALVGIQEPICVGDNLQYDGFVYHIETVEHRLQVNPASGHKTFSTHLAISYGVPAAGPVLPEIAIRQFESQVSDAIEATDLVGYGDKRAPQQEIKVTRRKGTSTFKGTAAAVTHKTVPSGNVEDT